MAPPRWQPWLAAILLLACEKPTERQDQDTTEAQIQANRAAQDAIHEGSKLRSSRERRLEAIDERITELRKRLGPGSSREARAELSKLERRARVIRETLRELDTMPASKVEELRSKLDTLLQELEAATKTLETRV